jgi:hypothetical protein
VFDHKGYEDATALYISYVRCLVGQRVLQSTPLFLRNAPISPEINRQIYGEIFYSIKELCVLAERWRIHYNTVRPHSSLGYKPPAPEAWLASTGKGHGEVETASRLPRIIKGRPFRVSCGCCAKAVNQS